MAYEIKINAFQGPFDLLFHLLDKEEINIYHIPIAQITEQYLEYINQMEILDLDVASEFLLMAARLLSIKAKMLLPPAPREETEDEELIDPREELVSQLLEYKMFKEIAEHLKEKELYFGKMFSREIDLDEMLQQYAGKTQLKNLTLAGLSEALARVIKRAKEQEEKYTEVEFEEITIESKMSDITKKILLKPTGILFSQLFDDITCVKEVVVTFLAILELTKINQILIEQTSIFSDILILRNESQHSLNFKEG